jgi:hypothetical protein
LLIYPPPTDLWWAHVQNYTCDSDDADLFEQYTITRTMKTNGELVPSIVVG